MIVLNFHGIGDPPRTLDPGEDEVWLTRDAFESALDVAASHPGLLITFDDANVSDVTIALPALVARRTRAAFFVPAGLVGRPGYLGEAQVRELAAAGMTVGSHGSLHRPWPELSDAELDLEIEGARDRLAGMLGTPVREAACPFGAYDRRVLRRLRAAGFTRVYTSDRGPADPDAWLLARNTIYRGHGRADVERIAGGRRSLLTAAARTAWLAVKRWR